MRRSVPERQQPFAREPGSEALLVCSKSVLKSSWTGDEARRTEANRSERGQPSTQPGSRTTIKGTAATVAAKLSLASGTRTESADKVPGCRPLDFDHDGVALRCGVRCVALGQAVRS